MNNPSPYQAPDSQVYDPTSNEYDNTQVISASQRIGRARFLAYNFLATLAWFVPAFIFGFVSAFENNPAIVGIVSLLFLSLYVLSFVASFIIARRRLHDLEQSGWMGLLYIIPLVNFIFVLYLIFAPGTKGSNKYGLRPSPNTAGVWIAAAFAPLLMIGVLAAIALPAYQDYSERAKAAQISE